MDNNSVLKLSREEIFNNLIDTTILLYRGLKPRFYNGIKKEEALKILNEKNINPFKNKVNELSFMIDTNFPKALLENYKGYHTSTMDVECRFRGEKTGYDYIKGRDIYSTEAPTLFDQTLYFYDRNLAFIYFDFIHSYCPLESYGMTLDEHGGLKSIYFKENNIIYFLQIFFYDLGFSSEFEASIAISPRLNS